jgi:hypothetical protein
LDAHEREQPRMAGATRADVISAMTFLGAGGGHEHGKTFNSPSGSAEGLRARFANWKKRSFT